MFDVVIVRYGELALKSRGVRDSFEKTLVRNIEAMLNQGNISFSRVYREWGRIFISTDDPTSAAAAAADVFGVVSTSPAAMTPARIKDVAEVCGRIGGEHIKNGETFGIRARRSGNHAFSSTDIGRRCGDAVWARLESLGHAPSVDLDHPDREIFVEMRQNYAYVFTDIVEGVGGLPLGTQGKMVALISGGIDSPAAAWLLMRRGVTVIPVYFNNTPYADESNLRKALECIRILQRWSPGNPLKVYEVPNGANLKTFLSDCKYKNTCIFCKRMMYRLAFEIMTREKASGIITGSSLGQVASQTAANMYAESYGLGIPIYHPLIGFDKTDIIDLTRRIGTYETSIQEATECGAVPEHPEVRARYDVLVGEEQKLDIDKMVQDSISDAKVFRVETKGDV
ncbi:MAG: tRNA uracil 4-sulfurtransferase ThiI [Euryarchaeota archaeon]|nr:tRNA uracil 4-sulfurtransferase ThiI [Euryarchaeota archaeon]